MKKWKPPISKKALEKLFDCWENSTSKDDLLKKIKEKIPEVSPPLALGVIRKMSKIDSKWILESRKKDRKKEEIALDKIKRKKEREKNKIIRKEKQKLKKQKEELKNLLTEDNIKQLNDKIKSEFFFCPDLRQQVNTISCIFRVFSNETKYGFSQTGYCTKCKRMNKYIPIIKEIIGDEDA